MRTFVDLFCGGGLGARGAVSAGLKPMLAVDLWSVACETYRANFPGAVVLSEPIEKIDPLEHLVPGQVDFLLASPECTNHSVAKGGAVRDEKSKETALYTIDWIASLKPSWFVIENVKEMKGWHRYAEFTERLGKLGYMINEEVVNAAEFGAPQSRVRLFLVGGRGVTPPAITPPSRVGLKTVRDILSPDGTFPFRPLFGAGRAESTEIRARNAIAELGRDAEFLLVYYGSGGDRSWQRLDQPLRTVTTIDRFAYVTKKSGRYVMRMLQPPELARAMALPNEHVFPCGTRRQKIMLCGNGICAPVIERIVTQLKEAESSPRCHAFPVVEEAA